MNLRTVRISALCIFAGLLVEAVSLLWVGPSAFLTFVFGGGLLVAAGCLLFLWALLRADPPVPDPRHD